MRINVTRQRLKYILSDYLCLNIGWLLCVIVRFYYQRGQYSNPLPLGEFLLTGPVVAGLIVFPLMMLILYWIGGFYNEVFYKSRGDLFTNTAGVSFIGTLIIFFVAMINDTTTDRIESYELIVILWALLFVPVLIGRMIINRRTVRLIRERMLQFPTLVIGTGKKAIALANRLNTTDYGAGFNVVGLVDIKNDKKLKEVHGFPVFPLSNIGETCKKLGIRRLVVVSQSSESPDTGELINSLFTLDMPIFITPDLYGLIVMRPRIGNVANEPMIDITQCHTSAATTNLKRISDAIIASITCVLLLPVYAAIAVAIRRDSPGPVFYSQERIGYHKHPFKIYKFRTMRMDAEENGPALTSPDDSRVTRVGRFLRKYRLDELPQFWNVVRGDMSLVGPRPEREYYIRQIVARAPYYNLIHQVRPGITSWGMVRFGYASNIDQMIERLRYDLIYMENVSLGVDLKILYYTINTVFKGKGM